MPNYMLARKYVEGENQVIVHLITLIPCLLQILSARRRVYAACLSAWDDSVEKTSQLKTALW